jgi:anti-sigma B factor antagonist
MAEVHDHLIGTRALECWASQDLDAVAVYVRGELDLATADELARVLHRYSRDRIVVDMTDLSFCDAKGLRVLLDAAIARRESGDRLVLRDPAPAILRLLEVTDTTSNFEIVP